MNGRKKCFICLDQGSTGSRALAVSEEGNIIARAAYKIAPSAFSDDTCEYDGGELLKSQTRALDEALESLSKDYKAASICVASQRSTVIMWDKITGEPLCPVLSWLDGRAKEEISRVALSDKQIHSLTGLYKTPYYSAPKIRWCLDNYERVARAFKKGRLLVGPVASYLIWNMTKGGVFAADATLAQRTMLFNIKTMAWDENILKSFGIAPQILPEVKNSIDDYGSYKGIPITVCAGDQQAAAAGMGINRKGDVSVNYGTGAFLLANAGNNPKNIDGILTSLSWSALGKKPNYILEAPLNVAGSLLSWLNAIGIDFNANDLPDISARAKNPVWFLPALGGLGAPQWDFSISPVITGLTPNTTKADIIAGALRGLAFLIADVALYIQKCGGLAISSIKTSGGLSENASLIQFQSDILGVNALKSKETEMTALGGAYLCALAQNVDAAAWPVFNSYQTVKPDITCKERAALYDKWKKFFQWSAIRQKDII